jgi:outer membrane protein assembly factor BamB
VTVSKLPLWILIAACFSPHPEPQAPVDWPRFRGPNGTGISSEVGIPAAWSETSGVLWKTALPGAGNSSPIVSRDRVFVQSASPDGRERLLLCLDAAGGRILWTRAAQGAPARINPRNTLASSTPATDGRRVYALSWDGAGVALAAYDFEGEPVWRRDLGAFSSEHGAGASPVVYGGKVFLADDADGQSALVALDAATGKPVWQDSRTAFAACYSTPFLLERQGRPADLVVVSTAGITGYDPETGSRRWHWAWPFVRKPLRTVGSPIYSDGLLFATSGDGGGDRHMVALRLEGPDGKPELAWESKRGFPYVPTMLVSSEYLYWVNDGGIAACHLARTGDGVWTERLGGNFAASPVLAGGKIYAAGEDGDVYVFRAAPKFELLARNALGEMVRATPAVARGRLFIRGRNHLFCIGAPPR